MTTCDDDSEYWKARIATVKQLIAKFDEALLQVGTGAVQQYSIDTGQTRHTVTKANLATIRDTRAALLRELAELQTEHSVGGGSFYARPGF